jgi:hypothetical protein
LIKKKKKKKKNMKRREEETKRKNLFSKAREMIGSKLLPWISILLLLNHFVPLQAHTHFEGCAEIYNSDPFNETSLSGEGTGYCDTSNGPEYVDSIIARNLPVITSGSLSVLLVYAAFSDTENPHQIPLPADVSNDYYPDNLGTYTILEDDMEFSPLHSVSGYLRSLSDGQIELCEQYVRVTLELASDGFGNNNNGIESIVNDALERTFEVDTREEGPNYFCFDRFDIVVVVIPKISLPAAPDSYRIYGNRVLLVNGYEQLRGPHDALNSFTDAAAQDYPTLFKTFLKLFGFPNADFEESDVLKILNADPTDIMGTGDVYAMGAPWTNPINLFRAGWLDRNNPYNARDVTVEGTFRVWPFRKRVEKYIGYDYEGRNIEELDEFYDDFVTGTKALILDPPSMNPGSSENNETFFYIRSERSYKVNDDNTNEIGVFDFYTKLTAMKFHPINDDNAAFYGTALKYGRQTTEMNPDLAFMSSSPLVVGETYHEPSPFLCEVTVTCRDVSSNPPSFLVQATCDELSTRAVTDFRSQRGDPFELQSGAGLHFYSLELDMNEVISGGSGSNYGYVSLTDDPTTCEGAELIAKTLTPSDCTPNGNVVSCSIAFVESDYNDIEEFIPVAICYAESSSQGDEGTDYTVQDTNSLVKTFARPASCSVAAVNCPRDFYFVDAQGPFCSNDPNPIGGAQPAEVCCFEGTLSSCNSTGCHCDCFAGYTGQFCTDLTDQSVVGNLEADFPVIKRELDSFPLHLVLREETNDASVTAECYATIQNGTMVIDNNGTITEMEVYANVSLGTMTFVSLDLHDSLSVTPQTGWSPNVTITCDVSGGPASNFVEGGTVSIALNISESLTNGPPENPRVKSYEIEQITLAWSIPENTEAVRDQISYRVWMNEGIIDSDSIEDYEIVTEYVAAQTTASIGSLKQGTEYTARVQSISSINNETGLSDSIYFLTITNESCTTATSDNIEVAQVLECPVGGCLNGGTCVSGQCWCQKPFHGRDCSLNACTQFEGADTCSNAGTCNATLDRCVCDDGHHGLFCEKYSGPNLGGYENNTIAFGAPTLPSFNITETVLFNWTSPVSYAESAVAYVYLSLSSLGSDNVFWRHLGQVNLTELEDGSGFGQFEIEVADYVTNVINQGDFQLLRFMVRDASHTQVIGTKNVIVAIPNPIPPDTGDTGETGEPEEPGAPEWQMWAIIGGSSAGGVIVIAAVVFGVLKFKAAGAAGTATSTAVGALPE